MRQNNLSSVISAAIICLLMTPLPAWSFEQKAHRLISIKAVEEYMLLYPAEAEKHKACFKEFIDASGDEDLGLQRPFNWHFYNTSWQLGTTWWWADKHNLPRFEKLEARMKATDRSDAEDRYELAGRLAHHIQDMSSPPHTVPVYHLNKDPFDKYSTGSIPLMKLTQEDLAIVRTEHSSRTRTDPVVLLHGAAASTLKKIYPQPGSGARDWSGFWRKYDPEDRACSEKPKDGFGCYGVYVFGDEAVLPREEYLKLYKEQIAAAIRDTLQLLVIMGK